MKKSKKINHLIRLTCLTGALFCYSASALAIDNTALPTGGKHLIGDITISQPGSNVMEIHQQLQNGVITWDTFNIGANAIVNFTGDKAGYNVLNYVNTPNASEIYGELNANNNGNIFLVNPAGVTIGKSAQINVGSLYVSNKKLNEKNLSQFNGSISNDMIASDSAAQLMSLGNINANKVTFVGDRIVLDVDRMKTADASAKLQADNIIVETKLDATDANIILGYDAYGVGNDNTYAGKNDENINLAKVNDGYFTKKNGYMWVEDVDQLQAINSNLKGNYALKNSIDAIGTKDWQDKDANGSYDEAVRGFNPLGTDKADSSFTGKFDGLNYIIFGLHIDRGDTDNVGLFGVTDGAKINNVTLVAGDIKGNNNVGSIVGMAKNTTISNSISSADVEGQSKVGGIVGYATKGENGLGTNLESVVNTAQVQGHENVGGLIGQMEGGSITGQSYNLGNVSGVDGDTGVKLELSYYAGSTNSIWDNIAGDTDEWNASRWGGNIHDTIWIEKSDGEIVEATLEDFKNSGYIVKDIRGFSVKLVTNYNDKTNQGNSDIMKEYPGIGHEDNSKIPPGHVEFQYRYGGQANEANRKSEIFRLEDFKNYHGNDYSHNIGGLVGYAKDGAYIGDAKGAQVFNQLGVTGGYNVGGVVGKLEGATVQNAANNGAVTANGYTAGLYQFHTDNKTDDYNIIAMGNTGVAKKITYAANVGGIVGYSSASKNSSENSSKSIIQNVINTGNITTIQEEYKDDSKQYKYYIAGNVGGIVGSAVDTNITSAENKENNVFGAHNVGGIAGYFEDGAIDNATNNGGEIKATGARGDLGFVKEWIRKKGNFSDNEEVIIGNIGGIVGYMYGDKATITGAGNRGKVHSEEVADSESVLEINQTANVGGIVGKIDRATTKPLSQVKDKIEAAAVSNSYNTGDVRGYTGVGGIAGMMYNGEIASSYNLGNLRSTFAGASEYAALNMGGIVGDATEETTARIALYDVYNKGTIGDEEYSYYGRHVGGIVGRLSGYIDKAYNTGAIYNGATSTGGIVGWWYVGDISNVFNTGNITVNVTSDKADQTTRVGGIAGSVKGNLDPEKDILQDEDEYNKLDFAYNLGTIRSFYKDNTNYRNSVGGIIGEIMNGEKVEINSVYTVGNIYAANKNGDAYTKDTGSYIKAIVGGGKNPDKITSAFYITPNNEQFNDLKDQTNGAAVINYDDRFDPKKWTDFFSVDDTPKSYASSENWRMYYTQNVQGDTATYPTGTTPILNAFMPNAKDYFTGKDKGKDLSLNSTLADDIASVQYGTAYNPLLTIVNLKDEATDLKLNWKDVGIIKSGGLAVYGGGLTIDDFANATGSNYFGGLLYADGALTINGRKDTNTNLRLGSASEFYGSSVDIISAGDLLSYGSIKATGKEGASNITISGKNVEIIGSVVSVDPDKDTGTNVDGKPEVLTTIDGIWHTPNSIGYSNVDKPKTAMPDVAEKYAYDVKKEAGYSYSAGDIKITATDPDGSAEVLLGNRNTGILSTGGSITVSGGSVYVDSDIDVKKDLTLTAKSATGEAVLDISNIGAARNDEDHERLYEFLDHFADKEDKQGTLKVEGAKAIIAVSMSDNNETYNMTRYDQTEQVPDDKNKTFGTYAENLQQSDKIHVWVSSGALMADIQNYADNPANNDNTKILTRNFALKNDIDMSDVGNYKAIGGDEEYTGTFDGRGNRIIGLDINETDNNGNVTGLAENVGLFTTIGKDGVVQDVKIYAGDVVGTDKVGLVAGTNKGTVKNITAFGNHIMSENNKEVQEDYVGGIVGVNKGTIEGVVAQNVAYSNSEEKSFIGGIAGLNRGTIENSNVNSALTVTQGAAQAMGGVAGKNEGEIDVVTSMGVIGGLYNTIQGTSGTSKGRYYTADQTGGVVGINNGAVSSAYNESIVSGFENVGGIIGQNMGDAVNVANASSIYGGEAVGGIVGLNASDATINSGRNNGVIVGGKGIKLMGDEVYDDINQSEGINVGGLVGVSEEGSIMSGLINDMSASITGFKNVGGIVGSNGGTLRDSNNLMNNGVISGYTYVGGIAGENTETGKIIHISNENDYNITINTNYDGWAELQNQAKQYFGGIVGHNNEKGLVADVINNANISVEGAQYVGGVIGQNEGQIGQKGAQYGDYVVEGYAVNNGTVTGYNYVGGVIGNNKAAIENTDLINTVNGVITGHDYVGGLIGENNALVAGSRNKENTLYENKVYNNGVVSGHDYVGGLIGNNDATGTLIAAYNTGEVSGHDYVGGIAGRNSGNIDQVFSSIMKAQYQQDGKAVSFAPGEVKGNKYVGGLVGHNIGVLKNAYSTSAVVGTSARGNVAGLNTGSAISVYSTLAAGNLIGEDRGNVIDAYSLSRDDANSAGVTVLTNEELLLSESYKGTFSDKNTWKFYNGLTAPLLKVFLTKADYQGFDGTVDGNKFSGKDGNEAYLATLNAQGKSPLLQAGKYDYWWYLYSGQIAGSIVNGEFSPNCLGYDLDISYIENSLIPVYDNEHLWYAEDKYPWYQWGKQRHERERKAEVNFVAGGMELN